MCRQFSYDYSKWRFKLFMEYRSYRSYIDRFTNNDNYLYGDRNRHKWLCEYRYCYNQCKSKTKCGS